MNKYLIFIAAMFTTLTQGYTQNCGYVPNQAVATVTDVSGCSVVTSLTSADQTISARDKVTLNPGFSVSGVAGHKLTIIPDHSIIPTQPIASAGTNDGPQIVEGGSRPFDKTTYIPGSIDGKVDIDQYGSATFSMPILVSSGSHGLQPQLVVNYNSQTENDILGYGFHLLGVSKISRTNKTKYYDGVDGSPLLGAMGTDALMLDGQRLIPTGTSTFSPENDPYTRVSWISATNSFEVIDKDGNKSEYGSTAIPTKDGINNNSQFKVTDGTTEATYGWGINKRTDAFGNYIEYIYVGNSTSGEYSISTINYTGNANTKPYSSIFFYYGKRNDSNTRYIYGNAITESNLLTSISVLSENQVSKKYTFSYLYDGITNKLNQIALTADGNSYNPTIINWIGETINDDVTCSENVTGLNYLNANAITSAGGLDQCSLRFGDINGDGVQDIIKVYKTYVDAFVNGTNYRFVSKPYSAYTTIFDVAVVDMDNNGLDEIYIHYFTAPNDIGKENTVIGYMLNNNFIYQDYISNSSNGNHFPSFYYGKIDNTNYIKRIIVPYDGSIGNAITQVVRISVSSPNSDGTLSNQDKSMPQFILTSYYDVTTKPLKIKDIKFLDFDGDGIMELLVIDYSNQGTLYKYDGSNFNPISQTFNCGNPADVFVGDFNGDGYSDILQYNGSQWKILYSKGKASNAVDCFTSLNRTEFPQYGPSQNKTRDVNQETDIVQGYADCDENDLRSEPQEHLYKQASNISIADMNNDGKSDIVYVNGENIIVLYSNGMSFTTDAVTNDLNNDNTSFKTYPYSDPMYDVVVYAVDVNNDGQKELIYGSQYMMGSRHIVSIDCKKAIFWGSITTKKWTEEYPVIDSSSCSEAYIIATFKHRIIDNKNIASIIDGNNIQSLFSYTSQHTNDNSNNMSKQNGMISGSYFLMPTLSPVSLATQLKNTDLNSQNVLSNSNYTFQNGYMNGFAGFLGYATITKSDAISGIKSVKNFSCYNNIYNTPVLNNFPLSGRGIFFPHITSEKFTKNSQPISDDTYTLAYICNDKSKILFLPYNSTIVHEDHLTGYSTTTTLGNFKYGRPWLITKSTSDDWTFKSELSYTVLSDNLTTQLQSEKVTQINNNGDNHDTYTSTTNYTYYGSSLLIKTVSKNGVTTTINKYDNYVNPTDITYTGDDGTTRTSKCGYDQYGRFKTSSTDAAGNISFVSYRAGDGATTSQTDINGLVTTFDYSSDGGSFVTKAKYPDGNSLTKTLAWDKSGSGALYTVESNQTKGDDVIDFYTAIGQKVKETSIGYSGTQSQGNTITKTFSYNPDGSLHEEIAAGYDKVYTYNPDGTLLNKTNSDNTDLQNISYTYDKTPYKVTITDNESPRTKIETFDALGHITGIDGTAGGSKITFDYFGSGKLKDRIGAGSEDEMTYDLTTLNQTSETNSDAKTTTFVSNNFGQLTKQTDAMSQEIEMTYYEPNVDKSDYGRLKTKQIGKNGPTDTYTYFQTPGKLGLIQNIIRDDGSCSMNFDYDNLGHLTTKTVTGRNKPNDAPVAYTTTYTYNTAGQLASTSYPSYTGSGHAGLTVNYKYDKTGNLQQITDASNNNIWHGVSQNKRGQWTNYAEGTNGAIKAKLEYGLNNTLVDIIIGTSSAPYSIQNIAFDFDNWGNLTFRNGGFDENFLIEKFHYDTQNRLKSSQVTGASEFNYTYDDANGGTIKTSTLSGTYNYTDNTHVPSSISGFTGTITGTSSPSLAATYSFTADNKISTIDNQVDNSVTPTTSKFHDAFVYGIDGNRFRCDFTVAGTYTGSKVYVDNCEFGYFADASKNYARTIIYAPTGVVAVWQDSGTVAPAFHYIHTDHLGSWLTITDDKGNVETNANGNEYRYSYDAWGRPRDPKTWNLLQNNTANALVSLSSFQPRFDHGYTGQEHLAGFGLINFNGRIYDPYQQMFVSPDPTVPHVDNPLSYNRYSYCLNNPLRYIDPSGFEDGDPTTVDPSTVSSDEGTPESSIPIDEVTCTYDGGSTNVTSTPDQSGGYSESVDNNDYVSTSDNNDGSLLNNLSDVGSWVYNNILADGAMEGHSDGANTGTITKQDAAVGAGIVGTVATGGGLLAAQGTITTGMLLFQSANLFINANAITTDFRGETSLTRMVGSLTFSKYYGYGSSIMGISSLYTGLRSTPLLFKSYNAFSPGGISSDAFSLYGSYFKK